MNEYNDVKNDYKRYFKTTCFCRNCNSFWLHNRIIILFSNIISLDNDISWYKWITSAENIQNLFPPGWTSIIVAVLFIGSIQLIGMGILGKYISILIDNSKKRPEFFIKEKSNEKK